jgi:hypothetical protein
MKTSHILRIGAIGSAAATLMLMILAVLLWPFGWAIPGEEFLAGQPQVYAGSLDVLRIYFTVDSVLILGWLVGWIGISMVVRSRHPLIGTTALILGIVGPMLDFAENEMVWVLFEGHLGPSMPAGWYLSWRVVNHLSYLIPYAASMVVAMGLWSRRPLDRVMCIIGTAGAVLATTGLYLPAMSLIADAWWLAWFACGSLLLWQQAAEWEKAEDISKPAEREHSSSAVLQQAE